MNILPEDKQALLDSLNLNDDKNKFLTNLWITYPDFDIYKNINFDLKRIFNLIMLLFSIFFITILTSYFIDYKFTSFIFLLFNLILVALIAVFSLTILRRISAITSKNTLSRLMPNMITFNVNLRSRLKIINIFFLADLCVLYYCKHFLFFTCSLILILLSLKYFNKIMKDISGGLDSFEIFIKRS